MCSKPSTKPGLGLTGPVLSIGRHSQQITISTRQASKVKQALTQLLCVNRSMPDNICQVGRALLPLHASELKTTRNRADKCINKAVGCCFEAAASILTAFCWLLPAGMAWLCCAVLCCAVLCRAMPCCQVKQHLLHNPSELQLRELW